MGIMEIIKFCKEEHNIRNGCHTLQLGTFDYYRTLDPEFSIADAEEGFIKYECKNDDALLINSRQLNAITGGGVTLTDKDSPIPPPSLSSVILKMDGSEFIIQADGTTKIKPGKVEAEVHYPNCYIFCCSINENGKAPNPKTISDEYNSYYKISSTKLQDFTNTICRLIAQNLLIGDLKLEGKRTLESHISTLGYPPNVSFRHGPVEYVKDKTIHLSTPEDFDENNWMKIFFQSMFKKDKKYQDDKEYRFVFLIEHPVHRFLPVVTRPKILELNPIYNLLE